MKHTFRINGGLDIVVEPAIFYPSVVALRLVSRTSWIHESSILIPRELAGVVAQAIEVTAASFEKNSLARETASDHGAGGDKAESDSLPGAYEKPLINAQALEAAKSFGEGMQV